MLRWLPTDLPLSRLFRALGMTDRAHRHMLEHPDLRLSRLVELADAMGVDRLRFLSTVLEESQRLRALPKPPMVNRRDPLPRPRKLRTGWYPRKVKE